jgi:hypothetical protein
MKAAFVPGIRSQNRGCRGVSGGVGWFAGVDPFLSVGFVGTNIFIIFIPSKQIKYEKEINIRHI